MKEDIEKIIYYGTLAPSGDNSQPWRFRVKENNIYIINIPERDLSAYNFNQDTTQIANGAVIENIVIAASNYGYKTEVHLFSEERDDSVVAKVVLTKSQDATKDLLLDSIEKRCTNRKRYCNKKLSPSEMNSLIDSGKEVAYGEIKLIDDKEKIKIVSRVSSYNEKLVLETKTLHDFLFKHVTWTDTEQENKRVGMDIKTFELKKPELLAFRVFKYWPIIRLFNLFGASNLVAKSNEQNFIHSSAIGIILTPSNSKIDYVNGGRLMQRVWLNATRIGLSMQLMTGISFFEQRIKNDVIKPFSQKQVDLIKQSYQTIKDIYSAEEKTAIMLFRVGFSDKPSGKCLRLKPEISFE